MFEKESQDKNMHWKTDLITWRNMQYSWWNLCLKLCPQACPACWMLCGEICLAPSTKMTHQLSIQFTWLVQNGHNIKTTHVAKLPFANIDVMDLSKTHLIGFQIPSKQWPIWLRLRQLLILQQID
jgi:hypothetical protein